MDLRRVAPLLALLLAAALWGPAAASAQDSKAAQPGASDPSVNEREAIEIARGDSNAIEAAAEHPDLHPSANQAESDDDWEVGFFADDKQLVQVVVDDESGEIEESWTGHQVAWKMARGYEGAFGRTLNAPWIWLPLCAIFLVGLFDWRRPLRIAHLDLLVIVGGFGVSHYFFNNGEIGLSVPLAYPALLYLMARMLWVAFKPPPDAKRRRRRPADGDRLRPSMPIAVIGVALLLLVGVRVALNVSDSNVIDVGYSGVIGGDKVADGEPIYGDFPPDNVHGDTYGPVAYYVYEPFEQIFPWSGSWDDLPAAHAAAIFFDLATLAGLFLLGTRLRRGKEGTGLGLLLAFGWAACPYTAFALESNTNDSVVSMLLVGVLLVLTSPPARGVALALASATKFAPLALVPLFATYDTARRGGGQHQSGPLAPQTSVAAASSRSKGERLAAPRGPMSEDIPIPQDMGGTAVTGPPRRALSVIGLFGLAFAVTTLVVLAQTILDPGISEFWDRTIANQSDRESPFSIWGQEPSLDWLHTAVKAFAVLLALVVAFVPTRRDLVTVSALGAAVLIAVQLTIEHWFYLYIPWFLPFLLVALLAPRAKKPEPSPG